MAEQPSNSTVNQVTSVVNLPGYQIKDVLGKGGMAVVYLAIQESIGREVALKILVPDHTDDTFTDRFLREAKIISSLNHPNIITVYDAGVHQGCHYMSMEYVPGNSLRESRDKLSRKQKVNIVKQVAQALDYAGKKGYVHRDIKPENILLHEDGRAILTDFGIARSQHATQGLTMTGKVIGTPYYMSPEQAKGIPVDHRSDIYSLGIVLFQALTGYLPYDGPSLVAIGIKHISDPIPELPPGFEKFQPVINTCLSKEPEHRYQTAEELYQALNTISESELDLLDAKTPPEQKVSHQPATDYHARTVSTEKAPGAPSIPPDQLRNAHISNSSSNKIKPVDPSLEMDDFYVTATDDYKRLKRRKRYLWLILIVIIGSGAGYYRKDDLEKIWITYLAPAIENAKQEFSQYTKQSPPNAVPEKYPEQQTISSQSTDSAPALNQPAADQSVDLSKPLAQQPENILALTQKYLTDLNTDPNDALAQGGLDEVTDWYSQQVSSAIQQNDLEKSRILIDQARSSIPAELLPAEFIDLEKTLVHQEIIDAHLQRAINYKADGNIANPTDKNAISELTQILKLEPEHEKATELLKAIADESYTKSKQEFKAGQLDVALKTTEDGLRASPKHVQLLAQNKSIQKEIALTKEIDALLKRASEQFKAGKIIDPQGESAVDIYRTILGKKQKHPAALAGLNEAEDYVAKQINTTIWENRLVPAEKYLKRALLYFPNSSQLDQTNRKLQIAKAKTAPRITHVLISQHPLVSLLKDQETITTTPELSIGFSYKNLSKETTILQLKIDSITENLNLINRKLIVSEKNGEHIFNVKHPLATFLPGQYRLTLQLENKTLLRHDFSISNQAPTKVQLR